jgi:translocation and assembly module TamA
MNDLYSRWFCRLCLGLLGLLGLLSTPGSAQTPLPAGATPEMSLSLVAPESVRGLLTQHLDLPAQISGDDAQQALSRRVRREAAELLATEGYFSPRIDVQQPPGATATLIVNVVPGPLTRVERMAIEFRGDLAAETEALSARREQLRAEWRLQTGAAFRSADWEAAKAALMATVLAVDFPRARIVESQAEIDPDQATARLQLTVDSGPVLRFGAVTVQGLKRYDAALVHRLTPFTAGEPYRRDALLAFQTRLQNTPWFHSVLVELDPIDPASVDNIVPVRVTLAESSAQRISAGLGYGTNSGARGELNYRHHDFLGRAWDLNSGIRSEEKRQSVFADLALVPDAAGYRVSVGGRLETTDIEGLITKRQVLGATRSRIEDRIERRLGLEWQHESQRTESTVGEINTALMLNWHWIRRAVDDTLQPRQGNLIELRLGGAAKQILSDRSFVRSHLRVQHWWPINHWNQRDTLLVRGELGFTAAASRAGIPQDYLFRTGGGQTVRGHAYQSLGVAEGNAVKGGRSLLVGSLEYTHWHVGPWGTAVFVDIGDAADSWRAMKPAIGAGIGARWQSPVGPLAFDLARGSRSARWYPHFALMVAF